MTKSEFDENYTKKQALRIHDASMSFGREVHSIVVVTAFVLIVLAIFLGVFILTQTLQQDAPAGTRADVMIRPASGNALTAAFTALLAVNIAVWFSPNTFRLGSAETPATIARELATQEIAIRIARICVLASLAVALWAFGTSVAVGPPDVDLIRMMGPSILGIGLAYWAAAAEVRIGASTNQRLLWAGIHREVRRLKRARRQESAIPSLSKSARVLQRIIIFGIVPGLVWGIALWIVPAPNPGTAVARLATTGIVALVGFFALREIRYSLIGRRIPTAVGFIFMLACVGALLTATATTSLLLEGATRNSVDLAPVGRGVLAFTLITISGPFLLLAPFSARRGFFGQPGLILDSVLRRYSKELDAAKKRRTAAKPKNAKKSQREKKKAPFAWAGVAAVLLPIPPFNIMLIAHAFRTIRADAARGRWAAWAAIWIGALACVVAIGLLLYAVLVGPKLVTCHHDAVCLA